MTAELDIGVGGCGIAGLAAATFLARAGHHVTIFDRLSAPAPVGSGLILQPVGLAVLEELGVRSEIQSLGARIDRLYGRAVPSGRIVLDVRYGALKEPGHGLAVHRATLFHVLHAAALSAGVRIEPGREISAAETAAGDGARFVFLNGQRSGRFDLAIDALGARSPLSPERGEVLPFGALWANVPCPEQSVFAANALEQRYVRSSKMVGVLPAGRLPGKARPLAAFFWSLKQADESAWRAAPLNAWKEDVLAIWPEAEPLLSPLSSHDDLVFARYSHRTLTAPASPGLAHLGDSFHAASPQLGQGANMALLDALALTAAMAEAATVPDALAAYASARRWHVAAYQLASTLFTPAYQSDSRWMPIVRDQIAGPLSRLPPFPRLLAALVAGKIAWPRTRLESPQQARKMAREAGFSALEPHEP